MPIDLHFVCKKGENFKRIGDNLFQTGDWTAGNGLADLAVGGRVYLHHAQKERAWHGGTIEAWKPAQPPSEKKKIFVYRADVDYKQFCKAVWARECAIARWNIERTTLLKEDEYARLVASSTSKI